jgi:hypothetical protein
MKIKMLTGIAGATWFAKPGDIVERDEKEAMSLCKAGLAEPVAEKASDKAEKRKK